MNSEVPNPHCVDSVFNNTSKKIPLSSLFMRTGVDGEDKKSGLLTLISATIDSGDRCVSQQLQAATRYKFAPRFTEILPTSLPCMVRIPPYLFK